MLECAELGNEVVFGNAVKKNLEKSRATRVVLVKAHGEQHEKVVVQDTVVARVKALLAEAEWSYEDGTRRGKRDHAAEEVVKGTELHVAGY